MNTAGYKIPTNTIKCHYSSGFATEDNNDTAVTDTAGKPRKLICGTEKGKHKCKNNKTAGMFQNSKFIASEIK